jgi:serine protease Do
MTLKERPIMALEYTAARFSAEVANLAARLRESVVQVHAGRRGIGSGVIWETTPSGAEGTAGATIVTNAHVVLAARGEPLCVRLADGRELQAEVIAAEPEHDLAALRVRAEGLRAAESGDSAALRVGELVLAVGNPFGREGAVTLGVVAARAPADPETEVEPAEPDGPAEPGRGPRWPQVRRMELIQADIRLYPGNSGGPLADAHGRVIGINSMIGGGLAFAIPSHTVRQFLGAAGAAQTPMRLGVEVLTVALPPAQRQRLGLDARAAVLVVGVKAGAPAEAAGVQSGDLLLALDGVALTDARLLPRLLARAGAAGPRRLTLLRGGRRIELEIPPSQQAAA